MKFYSPLQSYTLSKSPVLIGLRKLKPALWHFPLSFMKRIKIGKRRTITFPGGYRDFLEAGKNFPLSIEHLQTFSSTDCADNFLLIPQISHNMGSSCRQFFQMHVWGRQFISAFFLMQTSFSPIMIPPSPRKR